MWLIALMLLLMVPMVFAAVVFLVVSLWRAMEALLQGTVAALCLTWRAAVWTVRMIVRATRLAQRGAQRLRDWHHLGTTWSGQYLESSCRAWANMTRRRYIAGQLRRLRRQRHH